MKRLLIYLILLIIPYYSFSQANTYYISNNSNDMNSGKSPEQSWKTIKKIIAGNTYLLKRNDVFYFTINKFNNPSNKKTTIGAYGQGNKPLISLYKSINQDAWQPVSQNIWKVDLKNTNNYTGFLNNTDTNVGFLKANSEIRGAKLSSTSLLQKNWDFYSDKQYLYIYLPNNPSNLSSKVQFVTNVNIIELTNNMEVRDIALTGTGEHAVSGVLCKDDTLRNLDITEIGGSYLIGVLRYGNGIQFWQGASDCLVEGCNVSQVYDVAYTIQGVQAQSTFENIVFKNNKASNNEQSFEFWVKSPDGVFKNCFFINNYCTNAGYGWSYNVQPNKRSAVHLLAPMWNSGMSGLTISNNTFISAKAGYIYLARTFPTTNAFKSFNNKISLDKNVPLRADNFYSFKVNDGANFSKAFNLDKSSEFKVTQ